VRGGSRGRRQTFPPVHSSTAREPGVLVHELPMDVERRPRGVLDGGVCAATGVAPAGSGPPSCRNRREPDKITRALRSGVRSMPRLSLFECSDQRIARFRQGSRGRQRSVEVAVTRGGEGHADPYGFVGNAHSCTVSRSMLDRAEPTASVSGHGGFDGSAASGCSRGM
jgi:hypothetical protein